MSKWSFSYDFRFFSLHIFRFFVQKYIMYIICLFFFFFQMYSVKNKLQCDKCSLNVKVVKLWIQEIKETYLCEKHTFSYTMYVFCWAHAYSIIGVVMQLTLYSGYEKSIQYTLFSYSCINLHLHAKQEKNQKNKF